MSGLSLEPNPSSFQSLFPSTTCIKDFGYPDSHPLRVGDFDINNLTDDDDDSYHDNDFYDPTYFHNSNDDFNDNTDFYSNDEINRKAIALFDFPPENDNEVGLTEGQIIWISYRHGQGWLVAEDPNSGENGLVPEEYVEIIYDDEDVREDIPKPFLPQILQPYNPINDEDISNGNSKKNSKKKSMKHNPDDEDSEWVDTDFEDDPNDDAKDLTSGIKNTSIQ
ncbi:hypothetical protein HYPBUDRAFT_163750 [Hyphopichia burtonii NRRL Y-1933]|uniref:SH3 domain-containing protein n=1 Tax=Hyphopichia burtonii NRRL Y-1933 TaxID=984485 RepID=A0A1E4RCN2_9ASCO|nr:hypothetical protein HYPBUDRAFT_163750 [Hyphopichia burtonii NRRL Y-1933]ODV64996.1 hypothetical protein HYPBUDRAFT_163750 [Hyphopichia burtonii NRRL Y-1933]